jgi:hypothetical protein
MTRCSWVPRLLDWNTLHYNGYAGEKCNESSDREAAPDNPNLDFISNNSKKKHTDCSFAHANDHEPSYLAEQLIFDGREVYDWIADISELST